MPHPGQRPVVPRRRAVALAGAFFCLVGFAFFVQARDRAPAAAEWLEVVGDDDQGLELVLRAPTPERRERELYLPQFAWAGTPGLPIHFQRTFLVAVPGPRGASLEVLGEERERFADAMAPRVAAAPGESRGSEAPLTWSGSEPASAVSLIPGGRLRGRDLVTIAFTPLLFEATGGATLVRSVRVRLRFAERPRLQQGPLPPEPLHRAFVNAATASRWETHFERQKTLARTEALPDRRLRLRVPRTGLYVLNYDRLRLALGDAEMASLDPRTLQLFVDTWAPIPLRADSTPASWQGDYALREVPLWVQGEGDASFDTQDTAAFYALGPKEYLDLTGLRADSLLHAQNPYDRSQFAWLVWGVQPGLRAATVSSPEPGTPPDLVRSGWTRLHFEEDRQFGTCDDLWFWDEIRANNPIFYPFELDLGGATTPAAELRVGVSARESGRHAVDVRLNSVDVGDIRWSNSLTRPPNSYTIFPVQLASSNNLRLSLLPWLAGIASDNTPFVKFDVVWDRPLVLPSRGPEAGKLRWSRRPVTAQESYELAGFPQAPWVVDATDAFAPVRLVDASPAGTPGVWRLRYGRGSGIRTHFLAMNAPTLVDAADAVLRNVRPLRTPAVVPDMVVITDASLLQQADRFAQHRRAHFPGAATLGHAPEVQVVDVADIYENFSGGRVDPLAIRNYLKLLYTQPFPPGETAPRLRYALLFGEATHDPRQLEAGSTPTLVPTVHAWYADPMDAGAEQLSPQHIRRWFAVEDWLGEMDMPRAAGLGSVHAVPDVGIGRLTPRSLAEAQRLVDKIVEYDDSTDFDAWRTRVLLSADDECKPTQGCYEDEHVLGMERLVPRTPASWDIVKIYLTEYPATLGQKPQGRAAFIRAWSDGCALVCYQGHGAPRQLADEVLFLSTDIPALTNGRQLPVFMAYSCTVAEFDAPELQSMCEDMIASSAGGAIAAMAATQLTFADANADYNVEIWDAMFADGTTSKVPLGTIHMLGKSRSPASDGLNNEVYVLLGDPSMTLQSPEAEVTFTSGADSLQAGTSARVEAMVHLPGQTVPFAGFDGSADVEVLGSADDSGYQSPVTPFVRIPYDLPGPPLYRGRVSVQGGTFAFQFVVPLGAKLGAKARLSAYAFDASAGNDAKGAADAVRVVRAAVPDSSLGPPRIRLFFQNNLTQVKAGTQLFGEIRDENGINIQGTTLPSSILLDFDERNQPLNVTAQFRYADGSDSVGTVSVPLPEGLAAGAHKATMIASDNLQNRSTQSLDFQVVPASAELMANVVAFPNPFKDRTFFFFELTDPADVLLRVFTSSGREVWRYESFVDTPQQVSIRWDGLDFARDPLANGTYLYRVEARPRRDTPGEGPVLKHVGKVVIMRD